MPFQVPWNLTGGPVVTLPAGLTSDGRPVGLQLAAAPHGDELLLRLARAYEVRRPWELARRTTPTPRAEDPSGEAAPD
jgi:aspartyl-tRNA(Asn)/glutamyl-tRNA(Gln) amidotransferase subunit A